MRPVKQFELKACSECGAEYKHYATKREQLCSLCTTKAYRERNRLKPEEHKKHYPLDKKEQKKRYTRLRKGLDACQTREDKTRFFDEVLKEMHETGIYLWCIDLRQPIKAIDVGSGRRGRKPKDGTDPKKKYPDTRMKYEEL
jgi:hypothetical protein